MDDQHVRFSCPLKLRCCSVIPQLLSPFTIYSLLQYIHTQKYLLVDAWDVMQNMPNKGPPFLPWGQSLCQQIGLVLVCIDIYHMLLISCSSLTNADKYPTGLGETRLVSWSRHYHGTMQVCCNRVNLEGVRFRYEYAPIIVICSISLHETNTHRSIDTYCLDTSMSVGARMLITLWWWILTWSNISPTIWWKDLLIYLGRDCTIPEQYVRCVPTYQTEWWEFWHSPV
jgi:hypothetical protein